MFYREPSFLAVVCFGTSPPPPSAGFLCFWGCLCVAGRAYWRKRGWGRSKIIRRREILVLFESFNNFWIFSILIIPIVVITFYTNNQATTTYYIVFDFKPVLTTLNLFIYVHLYSIAKWNYPFTMLPEIPCEHIKMYLYVSQLRFHNTRKDVTTVICRYEFVKQASD